MKCGGCVSSVKDILEKQPGVSSVTVNLATETALVRVMVPRCKLASSSEGMAPYLKQLGEQLAQVREEGWRRVSGWQGQGFAALCVPGEDLGWSGRGGAGSALMGVGRRQWQRRGC